MVRIDRYQLGVSIIEIIIALVVIGVMVAGGITYMMSDYTHSYRASLASVAAALTSASNVNYALSRAGATATTINNCTDAPLLLANTGGVSFPAGYSIDSQAIVSGQTADCTLRNSQEQSISFLLHGV